MHGSPAIALIQLSSFATYLRMTNEPSFRLVDTEQAHERARTVFEAVSKSLKVDLPATADIRHIGATAIPGCLTKGDLDIVIRVPADNFEDADSVLASRFARNHGSIRTEAFSAFEDASTHPHLGIQLATIDGPFDFFHQFVEALQLSPTLVEAYNMLKRCHNGCEMAIYRKAKDAFVERVLADFRSSK